MKLEAVGPLPELGVAVSGIDLAQGVDDAQWQALKLAWDRHHLLVFRDHAHLAPDEHVALLERLGPVLEERLPGQKYSHVSNADGYGTDEMNDGYREGELTPHMDYAYTPFPADVISLFCEEAPEAGTHTAFYSNVVPLARMPAELRERLDGYTMVCAHDMAAMRPDARLYLEPRTDPAAPTQSQVWPLVRDHPRKPGVRALFCSMQQTERVVELSDEAHDDRASRELLAELFERHLYVEANEYVHEWRVGDLVVWDNLALQHARKACPRSRGARTFRRVATCEAGNGVHATVEFLGLADSSVAYS